MRVSWYGLDVGNHPIMQQASTSSKSMSESQQFLLLLLAADLVFIFLQIPYNMGMMSSPLFSIEIDRGYAEIYQYIKEFWNVLMLMFLVWRWRRMVYVAWTCLFIYILLDDSLSIHETLGKWIVVQTHWHEMLGLRARDYGELVVSAVAGTVLLGWVGISWYFTDVMGRAISRVLAILFVMLVFFGIGVDMFHEWIPFAKRVFGIMEDGGEMLVVSVMTWYLFKCVSFKAPAQPQQTGECAASPMVE